MPTVSLKHRPRQLLAVYAEEQRIEVVRAHRKWRSWEIDSAEHFSPPEGEPLYDYLQRVNLRPRDRKSTSLVLFLPRTFYNFHREHYPSTLMDQLDEALNFDWPENIFHDHEKTLHFFGPAALAGSLVSVPIFSLRQDIYDKFYQALGGASYRNFTIVPSALAYSSLRSAVFSNEEPMPVELLGRIIDPSHLEIHRFHNGQLLDSIVVGENLGHLRLFLESLQCVGEGPVCEEPVYVHLVCTSEECADDYGQEWRERSVPIKLQPFPGSLLSHWIKHLLDLERVQTFDTQLYLKPWQVPRIAWPLAVAVGLYLMFAFYQYFSLNQLQEQTRRVKKQVAQMESEWKPIEQLQARVSKFQGDQKTLSEFNSEGYPLLELLTVLTQITPDDTSLNYLSLRKGQIILRGESKSAIKYLPELSKVEGFSDVRFASPVTRNPTSDEERFNLQFQLDTEKFKKTVASLPAEKSEETSDAEKADGTSPSDSADERKKSEKGEGSAPQSQATPQKAMRTVPSPEPAEATNDTLPGRRGTAARGGPGRGGGGGRR